MEVDLDEWEEAARAREARRRNATGEEALVLEVSAILFAADPIGINLETNLDEYDPEAQSIVTRLPEAASAQDLQSICVEEFTHWFAADLAGPVERYEAIARDIWDAAARHSR
jgi:hypothetical protein